MRTFGSQSRTWASSGISSTFSHVKTYSVLAAGAVTGAYVLALSYFSASLAKILIFNVYVSELVAVIAFCLLLGLGFSRLLSLGKATWFALLFSFWCILAWALPDFLALWREHASLARFARHSVLYVYPMVWLPLGYAFRAYMPLRAFQALVWGLLASQIVSGLLDTSPYNLAIGPLYTFLLPLSFLFPACLGWIGANKFGLRAFRVVNTLAFVFPFATAALITQRSSFLNTSCDFAYGIALGLRLQGRPWPRTLLVTAASVLVLLLCSWPPANWSMYENGLKTFVSDQMEKYRPHIEKSPTVTIFGGYQHADDFSYKDGKPTVFQFRFRRELWRQSLIDWKEGPIFGQGFRVEVPSKVFDEPNVKHPIQDIEHSFLPISGPHNSYLNLLVRTGAIGILLWLTIVGFWFRRIYPYIWKPGDISLAMAFVCVANGMVYSLFNLGFEGPQYAIPIYFLLGATYRQCESKQDVSGNQPN